MKGFPNQVSDLMTLGSAMKVLMELHQEGKNPKKDDVFGEALIRRGVLGTGHMDVPVEVYLAKQKKKTPSYQSFRTRARGLRELFRVLGLIDDSGDEVVVSAQGRQIASFGGKAVTPEALRLWRMVICNMAHDGGDGERSHPYQVLLRLVAKKPGITRAKCALALEAKNDSDSELDRIVKLADLEEDEIRKEIGETESNWDNAKKILPRFAEELGDVRKSHGEFFVSDAPGQIGLPGEWLPSQKTKAGLRRPRSSSAVTSETIARIRTPEQWDESEELLGYEVDPEALKARKAKLRSRLMRHNAMVQKLAKCLQSEGAELYENPFDCLACFPTEGVLAEVKSLDGTEKDEIARVRDALGQLLYYESFVTQPLVKGKVLKKVACFESKISDQHLAWLQENDIQVVWDTGKGFDGSDQAKKALSGHLGFK